MVYLLLSIYTRKFWGQNKFYFHFNFIEYYYVCLSIYVYGTNERGKRRMVKKISNTKCVVDVTFHRHSLDCKHCSIKCLFKWIWRKSENKNVFYERRKMERQANVKSNKSKHTKHSWKSCRLPLFHSCIDTYGKYL